jgi:hypothetical protein
MGTLTQTHWRVYADDAAEPTSPLANEDAAPTLTSATPICRIRMDITNTGSGVLAALFDIQYSTDDVNFVAMGSAHHWDYANGMATEGDTVAGLLISDTVVKRLYCESGTLSPSFQANSKNEFDFAVAPTANATAGTLYYFRFLHGGVAIALGAGASHPQITTYAPPSGQPTARRHQGLPCSAVGFYRQSRQR